MKGEWAPTAAFKGSAAYNTMAREMRTNDKIYVSSTATCGVYTASQNTYDLAPVSKNFAKALELLDSEADYFNFINTFGTHYVKSI